jgi:hypothetical protein
MNYNSRSTICMQWQQRREEEEEEEKREVYLVWKELAA